MENENDKFAEMSARLDVMKREVDSLQIMLGNAVKPLYRDAAAIISILALMFSFGTTTVSYLKADQQEVQTAKSDLRGLLQRLAALPKENLELLSRYQQDANTAQFLSGYINQENALLSKQAVEIARRIPHHITSTEYFAIHSALRISSLDQLAVEFLEKAVQTADNTNDAVAALRAYGTHLITTGQVEAGRDIYRRAVNLFNVYSGHNDYYQKSTHVLTYLNWYAAEINIGATQEAARLLALARELQAQLAPGPFTDQLAKQIEQVSAGYVPANKAPTTGSTEVKQ